MMEIDAPTTMDAWKLALAHIRDHGEDFRDDDLRTCREALNLSVRIEHPEVGNDEPIEVVRKIDKWVYPSKDEMVGIVFNQMELPLYDYTYGSRMFNYQGELDQVNGFIIPLLKKNLSSRRATVITIDPLRDLDVHNRNIPGLISLHFKVYGKRLLVTSVIRSNDFFIGWPANIYQLATLQKYIADELGLQQGSLTTYSLSAHVFAEYKMLMRTALRRASDQEQLKERLSEVERKQGEGSKE